MINPNLNIPQEKIADFCRRHRIKSLSLFGSATREDFRPDSDVDVLVEFDDAASATLFDIVDMQDELTNLFGRPVDLLTRSAVERNENYIRRKHILSSVEPVYVAR
jgi:predicted nucleotidyltransferase